MDIAVLLGNCFERNFTMHGLPLGHSSQEQAYIILGYTDEESKGILKKKRRHPLQGVPSLRSRKR